MSGILNLYVISPDTHSERRLDPHLTVGELKSKLEFITGIPAGNQSITLVNSEQDSRVIAQLSDDSKKLGYYSPRDFQVLKVEDLNPSETFTGQLTDVSQVEKFELSDEAYAERPDTVLAYKQRNKVGRFAPKDETKIIPEPKTEIPLGSRCEVDSTEPGLNKRGTVRFVGQTKFGTREGTWIGVEYDEPFGKHDGSVQGVRYFTCRPNYGAFVRADKIRIGDYPVLELDLEDEEM